MLDAIKVLQVQLFGETEEGCCVSCKQPFKFTGKNNKKLGNVYTQAGLKETQISQLCETCFDKMMKG